MARPEVTGKGSERKRRDRGVPTHAFTIQEFCDAHRLSRSRYYELRESGLTPVEMVIGRKRLISVEAAERWRREQETAA
jgi:hypothetical protein